MALRDQPYIPLYVQDVLTDEKLIECSAAAHGVYLRLLCILHKQDIYGLLCLKQKYKQTLSKYSNFALMLNQQMPFEQKQIQECLEELDAEGVIKIDDDKLSQKRMVQDGEISLMRANVGKTGGSSVTKQYGKSGYLYWISDGYEKNKIGISVNPQNRLYRLRSDLGLKKLYIEKTIEVPDMGVAEDLALNYFDDKRDGEWVLLSFSDMKKDFVLFEAKYKTNHKAKNEANAEYETEYKIGISDNDINTLLENKYPIPAANVFLPVYEKMMNVFLIKFSGYFRDEEKDFIACQVIAGKVEKVKGWGPGSSLNGHLDEMLSFWSELVDYIAGDSFLLKMDLAYHSTKGWQRLGQHMAKVEHPEAFEKGKKDPTEGMSDYEKEIYFKRQAAKNKKS
jgi:hypothetical protein